MKKVIGEQAGLYSALFLGEGSWTDSIRIIWGLLEMQNSGPTPELLDQILLFFDGSPRSPSSG